MDSVFAEVITIGDEILYGHITDTNSQWISQTLGEAGFIVKWKTTVGDEEQEILKAFETAEKRASVVLTTGGLGPTKDDKTLSCLAQHFNQSLQLNDSVLKNIETLYFSKGRELNKYSYRQATIPSGATPIKNELGTAPGIWLQKEVPSSIFISMPGVPHEMQKMMMDVVVPNLRENFKTPIIKHTMVKTVGVPETSLSEILEAWEDALPAHIQLAYLPRLNQVRLRLTVKGFDQRQVDKETEAALDELKNLIGTHIFAIGEEDLPASIGKLLIKLGKTVATAESCTGGLIADSITNVAGCSAWYQGGIVAYSNNVKISQLGVKAETIEQHGAVSEEAACEMAENVRIKYGASFGISTTGIAGPTGAVPGKPVGTVFIGYSDETQTFAEHLHISEDRFINVNFSANAILELLRKKLTGM